MIPNRYMNIGEGALASYDFVDIVSGLGYQTFYGHGISLDGEDSRPALSDNAFDPGNTDPTTSNNHEKRYYFSNLNCQLSGSAFNLPRIAKGTAFVIFTLANTTTNTASYSVVPTILNNNVFQASGSFVAQMPATASAVKTFCIPINISTPINFKKDDVLSLQIATVAGAGTRQLYCEMNPLNTNVAAYVTSTAGTHPAITATTNTTALTLLMPFRIDL